MMIETTYEPCDLKSGICTSCGEYSDEILVGDHYGSTQYLTKAEYELYLENIKKLKNEKESDLQSKD
jgi:hypothetical protein